MANAGDVVNGPDQQTSKFVAPPESAQPQITRPTWQQAQASDNPAELTKGGKLASLLQVGLEGAARGAAAGVPTNPHISPGLGPSLEAGVETPFAMKQQANALLQQNLEQQKEKAQIAALPLQAQTELGLKRAQTEWYNQRGEAVGEHNLKPGDVLVDKDGNVVTHGGSVADTAAAKAQGKGAGTIAAVQNAGGTIEQAFAALGIKNPTPQNKTEMQAYIDANKGDIGAAIKQRNADRVNTSGAIHASIAKLHAVDGGDSPTTVRTVNADPQYSGLKQQRNALLSRLAAEQASGAIDAPTVNALQTQADTLTQKMTARRSQIVPTPNAAPVTSSHAPGQFSHVSASGKYGWNGQNWVPIAGK
jgi:hypothetical protein